MKLGYAAFCLLGIGAGFAKSLAKPKFKWNDVRYLYAFGDSYTFVQGTKGLANFSFIGDYHDLSFTPKELTTNKIIPKNTSSDGANWSQFLTGCYGGLPSKCKTQLWNFAFAGADISGELLPLHHDFTVPLVDQVRQYVKYASHVLPHPKEKTLTAWWIGINDTGDVQNNATISDWPAFWSAEMDAYFSAVTSAHTAGLTHHLFLTVPPGDRTPARLGNSTAAAINRRRVDEFNSALQMRLTQFSRAHPDAIVLKYDAHAFFNKVLDDYPLYGFKNTTGYCTCTDDSFFWYNTGHPTQRVHKLLAEDLARFLQRASAH